MAIGDKNATRTGHEPREQAGAGTGVTRLDEALREADRGRGGPGGSLDGLLASPGPVQADWLMTWSAFNRFARRYQACPWEFVEDWKQCRFPTGTHYLWVNRRRFYLSLKLFCQYTRPGQNVLDVGAFPGTWIRVIQELCPERQVQFSGAGLSLSDGFREYMNGRGVPLVAVDLDQPIRPYQDPVAPPDLPWETGHFDAVCAFEILEHLRNPFHFMAEISRVLKPGGHLFLSTNNVCYVMNILRLLTGRTVYWHLDLLYNQRDSVEAREHVREYTIQELRLLCDWYGLTIVRSVFYDAAEYAARILSPVDRIRFLVAKPAFIVPHYHPNLFIVAQKSGDPRTCS